VHLSNGSVETAEYKDIKEHLDGIELMKQQTAEADKERRELLARKAKEQEQPQAAVEGPPSEAPTPPLNDVQADASAASDSASPTLEQHVKDLRRQVERLVKAPGAPLKSAPFHTASTLQSLASGTEVLIQISTPYWYGVETRDGQHGWISRDQLEQLP
jgi:hypothetical protein